MSANSKTSKRRTSRDDRPGDTGDPVAGPIAPILGAVIAIWVISMAVSSLFVHPTQRADGAVHVEAMSVRRQPTSTTSTSTSSTTSTTSTTTSTTTTIAPPPITSPPTVPPTTATSAPTPPSQQPQISPNSGYGNPYDPATWDRLAVCESGGNWSISTGMFEGGVQFLNSTWLAVGGGQYAQHAYEASREDQIAMAIQLWQVQGWNAWPTCSRQMGYL